MNNKVKHLFFSSVFGFLTLITCLQCTNISKGELAPEIETTLADGTPFKLSNLKGSYVLLDFWGSWCPPCRKENPKLVDFYNKYKNEIVVVSVAFEKDNNSYKKAIKEDGITWKNQIIDQTMFVRLSAIARSYGVTEIPTKFLISPEGKLLGELSFSEIEKIIKQQH